MASVNSENKFGRYFRGGQSRSLQIRSKIISGFCNGNSRSEIERIVGVCNKKTIRRVIENENQNVRKGKEAIIATQMMLC